MLQINTNPSGRELNQFGALWLIFSSLVAAAYWYRGGDPWHTLAGWTLALGAALIGFLSPAWMRLLFVGLSVVAYPIGWVVSHLLLSLIYYLVLTPIGLGLRILGRNPLQKRFDRSSRSYWHPIVSDEDPKRYFRQF